MFIYLARHGETEWNALGRLQGTTDVPLNETGREQARALGEKMRGADIVSVTTSDLIRALQTGEEAAKVLGITEPITIDPELQERSFGIFEGLTRVDLETHHAEAWAAWRMSQIAPPGAEQTELVVARMERALRRIVTRNAPGNVLVVSHGAAMRLVMNELTGTQVAIIPNGAVYRIGLTDHVWSVIAHASP